LGKNDVGFAGKSCNNNISSITIRQTHTNKKKESLSRRKREGRNKKALHTIICHESKKDCERECFRMKVIVGAKWRSSSEETNRIEAKISQISGESSQFSLSNPK